MRTQIYVGMSGWGLVALNYSNKRFSKEVEETLRSRKMRALYKQRIVKLKE